MARFALSTPTDRSATAWISSILSLVYTSLSLLARYYLKSGTVSVDDAAIVVAQILAFAQFGATFYGITQGLGKDLSLLDGSEKTHSANAFEASEILYVLALAAAKISMAMLIDRIFSGNDLGHEKRLVRVLMGVIAFWGVGSALAVSVSCNADQILPMHGANECTGSTTRWLVVTIFDCLTEFCLVLLPAYFLTGLQMTLSNKITAGIAFAFRLGCVPFSAVHYATYHTAITSSSFGTTINTTLTWQQWTLCYSLLAATIPLSRVFFKRFETGNVVLNQTGTYSTQGGRQDSTFKSSKGDSKIRSRDREGTSGSGRFWSNPKSTYSTAIYHEEAAKHNRVGSEDMIIWREDQVSVQRSG